MHDADLSPRSTPDASARPTHDAEPIWRRGAAELSRTPLGDSTRCAVCVVGAGIFGLTTAYLLQHAGHDTIVLDDGPIAGGQTSRTTAHLASALDRRYSELERVHGKQTAQLVASSHVAAIAAIERIVREENLRCELQRIDGFLYPASGSGEDVRLLREEHDAAARAGLEVEMVSRAPVASFDTGPALRFANQGRIHPLLYLAGLARAFERAGGRIHTGTRATAIRGGDDACVETASGHRVRCDAVVVATNAPVNDRFVSPARQAPYMTYVVGGPIEARSVPDVLLWDTDEPYHYVRLVTAEDGDRLIVGGEDHKTGQARDGTERFARLESWARERFPGLGPIDHRWAGQVLEPDDGLAYIGRAPLNDDNVFFATGFSGNGITYGTLAGLLVSDLVTQRENPWIEIYDPLRMRLRGLARVLRENLNVAARYGDWLKPGEVGDEARIAPGSGAVLRSGLDRIAVYRDPLGRTHRLHAACPHLGCAVAWNDVERTWDCPCHGSRFTPHGRVIVGPANRDLSPVEPERREERHGEQEQV